MTQDDDDIQDYVRPWVGLTDDDRYAARAGAWYMDSFDIDVYTKIIEAKLKEKNHG